MELFDLALQATTEEFQKETLKWLESRIGFDGVIWGVGARQNTGVMAINSFLLSGRPQGLIEDYPISAAADPVSTQFLEAPTVLQNVSTHKHYLPAEQGEMRQYLEQYRVRHLQIVGSVEPTTSAYSWIVCYREDQHRAFLPELEGAAKNAVTTALLAGQFHRSAHLQLAFEKQIGSCPDQSQTFSSLTPRQLQVLYYLEQGWSNKLISHHLNITENTVKSHMKQLFLALGVNTRSQALIVGRKVKSRIESDLRSKTFPK